MGWAGVYHVFSESFSRVELVGYLGKVWHLIVHPFSVFGKGKTRVLQHLLGSLWLLSFDYVILMLF